MYTLVCLGACLSYDNVCIYVSEQKSPEILFNNVIEATTSSTFNSMFVRLDKNGEEGHEKIVRGCKMERGGGR